MDADRHADLDASPDRVLVEYFAALGDVGHGFAEPVMARPARFLERDYTSRGVFGNCPAAFGRGGGRRCARSLRPSKRGDQCQRDAEYCLFHFHSFSLVTLWRTLLNSFSHEKESICSLFFRIRTSARFP